MNRIIFTLLFTVWMAVFASLNPTLVFASEQLQNAGISALLTETGTTRETADPRVLKLTVFLNKQDSELTEHAKYIVALADTYDIPWNLVTAIAGVESTYCKNIPVQSYNCWGWANGKTKFTDYRDALEVVSRSIRTRYFDRGLDTPEKMQKVYAPPSTTWAGKVRRFMEKIEGETIPDIATLQITI